MKILYLYSELVGYQIPIFEIYVKEYNAEVHVINWDKKKLKPYNPPEVQGVTYYKRSEFSNKELLELCKEINPGIIYISGWMDKGYLFVARYFRKKGVNVVTAFDDQWKGNLRQKIGRIYFYIFLRRCYSHAWVAGPLQFEYAKRLGFKNSEIVYEMLSGNTTIFQKGKEYLQIKKENYPQVFLYVGNFRHVKGTDILIDAYKIYRERFNGNWKLICVGNGDYKHLLEGIENVEVINFSDQSTLVELTQHCGIFILPSRRDQWGVVVHEFAAAAMPLILSEGVGAKATFFIKNYNGLNFSNNSSVELALAMRDLSTRATDELIRMGENSNLLSLRISPNSSAANFMSLIKR
jgi:glycosyltransferase involved in cell wall biosynthesis